MLISRLLRLRRRHKPKRHPAAEILGRKTRTGKRTAEAGTCTGITREGTGHRAGITREGTGHRAGITREGTGHHAGITREGTGHHAAVAGEWHGNVLSSGLPVAFEQAEGSAVQLVDEAVGIHELERVAGPAKLLFAKPGVGVHFGFILEHIVVSG